MKRYLNLGCGGTYREDWTNVDFFSGSAAVMAHDLTLGIPFPNASFDLVYHSHMLEHFSRAGGERLVSECRRVLAPGGVLRVAVPDLEGLVREYLKQLSEASIDDADSECRYDWIVIELFDQMIRGSSGGEMLTTIRSASAATQAYIRQRIGLEADLMLGGRPDPATRQSESAVAYLAGLIRKARDGGVYRRRAQRLAVKLLGLQPEVDLGRFRRSGEIHQWMYDHFSLGRLLGHAGFVDIVRRDATTSYIDGWSAFHLDSLATGETRKPDSLFMEARAPF